jgi:hypothetical protein
MIHQRGFLARPFDFLFGNGTRVAVLRAVHQLKHPASGRALARAAGVNHQAAANALKDLARVRAVKRSGRGLETRWSLDEQGILGYELVRQAFKAEEGYSGDVVKVMQDRLRPHAKRAFLYGAAAKGKLEPGATLRFAAVPSKAGKQALSLEVRRLASHLADTWCLNAEGRVVSEDEGALLSISEQEWQILPHEGRG